MPVLQIVVGSHVTGESTPPAPIANTDTLDDLLLETYTWVPLGSTAIPEGLSPVLQTVLGSQATGESTPPAPIANTDTLSVSLIT